MDTVDQAQAMIFREITSDDSEVRGEYLKHFEGAANGFAVSMAKAFVKWRDFDNELKGDERRAQLSALVYVAITLHVLSMKAFLAGQPVAAGNLFRQVLECIALALLCSGKELDVLKRFMEDKYSSNDAIRDVLRHHKKLSLKGDVLEVMKRSQDFYHKYSHVTTMTIAAAMSFSQKGGLYVGASFDDGKLDAYKKENNLRVSLADVFPNFVDGVFANVAKW
ncbi:MAG: DUF2019 domain-containing protein [Nitrospira sp.]|nr:DUF2019 domain-containing protein [Nitrospira sp.]MDH4369457.1 DUF2019 domain-containing protein [Nitrospira sp.]MDH5346736.1 DUF2019 domain-containing protein [Nitrospira sp.]MDH5496381.1 DUF2019 domain-containing protein [Nitrospira sp.]MDH5724486.1 DUF2019 domain-containing protein [Nitrospira sp.]